MFDYLNILFSEMLCSTGIVMQSLTYQAKVKDRGGVCWGCSHATPHNMPLWAVAHVTYI